MTNRKYLVFCRASDQSLHKQWLEPSEDRNFDLFIEYYGDQQNQFFDDCEYYSLHKEGSKWTRFPALLKEHQDLIFSYDAIMIADDDLSMNSSVISQAFEILITYNLLLAQSALTPDSFYSHDITRQREKFILRYTNYVEGMLPIFSKEALMLCWPTFEKSISGWGLDQIWFTVLGCPKNKIAIIDTVPVKHTRAVFQGDLYKTTRVNPWNELETIKKEYGVKNFYPSEFGGIVKPI